MEGSEGKEGKEGKEARHLFALFLIFALFAFLHTPIMTTNPPLPYTPSMPRARSVLLLWLASDLLFFILSYVLAYFERVGWILSSNFPLSPYLAVVALVSPLWLFVLATTRTFTLTQSQWRVKNVLHILYACVVGSALFAITYFFLYGLFFSRMLLLESLLFSVIIVTVWHLLFQVIGRRMLWKDPAAFPTLIIGTTREAGRLIQLLQKRKNPLRPVAILEAQGTKEKDIHGVPVIGRLDKLETTLKDFGITHMIQCSDLEQSINLMSACRAHGITYLLLPSVLGIIEKNERTESLEGWAVTSVRPKKGGWERFF